MDPQVLSYLNIQTLNVQFDSRNCFRNGTNTYAIQLERLGVHRNRLPVHGPPFLDRIGGPQSGIDNLRRGFRPVHVRRLRVILETVVDCAQEVAVPLSEVFAGLVEL